MYPDLITIKPLDAPPNAVIEVPGSKSITNRAMILAALAEGESTLHNALDSDDTRVMAESLRRLGFDVFADPAARTIRVVGRGGAVPASQAELMLNNSGTSIRFLTALTALGSGRYRLDGEERMRERPQQDLLDALRDLGVGREIRNLQRLPAAYSCVGRRTQGRQYKDERRCEQPVSYCDIDGRSVRSIGRTYSN